MSQNFIFAWEDSRLSLRINVVNEEIRSPSQGSQGDNTETKMACNDLCAAVMGDRSVIDSNPSAIEYLVILLASSNVRVQ
jgi:hypothetical protein